MFLDPLTYKPVVIAYPAAFAILVPVIPSKSAGLAYTKTFPPAEVVGCPLNL